MKYIDRLLQRWRINQTRPYVSAGNSVLDVGCADDSFVSSFPLMGSYVGIDPDIPHAYQKGIASYVRGWFPADLSAGQGPFDVIVILAVLEHIPTEQQPKFAANCAAHLKPGGHLLISVPSPIVDQILKVLKLLRLIDGMSLEQHYGYDIRKTPALFAGAGLELVKQHSFELGLNNFFAFKNPIAAQDKK
jgi:2-polyprenyl-3-methyl-5-hydroxy-6-metoxy-1,4-benzoquinol methylase